MRGEETGGHGPQSFLDELWRANVKRCNHFGADGLMDWSPAERGNELAGEVGELCNELKKLLRFDRKYGVFMSHLREVVGTGRAYPTAELMHERDAMVARIRNELGDVIICASLIAAMFGIDLEAATRDKFNATSAKIGSGVRL